MYHSKSITYILGLAFLMLVQFPNSAYAQGDLKIAVKPDSTTQVKKKSKKDFKEVLTESKFSKFVNKVYHLCVDVDTDYCTVLPWDASAQISTSMEQDHLTFNTNDGLTMKMSSDVAYKVGPYLGYGPFKLGYMFRLNPTGRRKMTDFSFSLCTNIFNLDIIYRRTGGDYNFRNLEYIGDNGLMSAFAKIDNIQNFFSNQMYNNIFSINASWIPNHKKFINMAAMSFGYIQKKSAGSPIFGFGYSFQKLESDISDGTAVMGLIYVKDNKGDPLVANTSRTDRYGQTYVQAIKDIANGQDVVAFDKLRDLITDFRGEFNNGHNAQLRSMMLNSIPCVTRIYDWHLQIGYAYNFVLSKKFLIGAQLIAMPAIKRMTADNYDSFGVMLYDSKLIDGDDPRIDIDRTNFGIDVNARLNARWYHKQWFAGLTGQFYGFYYDRDNVTMNNKYWSVELCGGYNFFLKSLFKKRKKK